MGFHDYFIDGNYIGGAKNHIFPYIRRKFPINDKIKYAKLYISALGFCELYLNGKKITDDLYITPLSSYCKQTVEDNLQCKGCNFFADDLSHTIYVSEFDVTEYILNGDNVFGLVLAGGWYRSGLDKHKNYRNYGDILKVCFRIEIVTEKGETINIVSDEKCKYKESFLVNSGIFTEEQDENKEIKDFTLADFDDNNWENCLIKTTPDSKYMTTDCPPNRVIKYLKPKLIRKTKSEKVYDMGQNITGYPVITGASQKNDNITCMCSEVLNEDSSINEFHAYNQILHINSDGRKEHFVRFMWYGFRYFSISTTGNIDDLSSEKCAIVYADIENTSSFKSDNEIINFIYNAYVLGQQENFQCGVPTDCPQIEKKGYTGDGQLLCNLGMTLFDSRKLYKKWLNDIADVQDTKTGYVHNTAPCFIGCSGGVGGWSTAIINVPYAYYKIYGDKSVLEKYYDNMKLFTSYMNSESVDDLINVHTRTDAPLGDWSGPKKPYPPEEYINSCLYVKALMNLCEIAEITGKTEDKKSYEKTIKKIKQAINNKYFNVFTGNYYDNTQGVNAFALDINIGDERTIKNLVDYYEELGGYDTGIFGTDILTKVLFEYGYENTAIKILTSKNEVSYYSWMKDGATTLYESWLNTRSLNHPMFGSVVRYFIEYILGIRQGTGCGYENIVINPVCTNLIKSAEGKINTVKGEIKVAYKNINNVISFEIVIPENTNATFMFGNEKRVLSSGINQFIIDNK